MISNSEPSAVDWQAELDQEIADYLRIGRDQPEATWAAIRSIRFRRRVAGKTFILRSDGEFIEDDNGEFSMTPNICERYSFDEYGRLTGDTFVDPTRRESA